MKVEMAESLMMSWLKHVKNCQIVQLNWKPSVSSWQIHNQKEIDNIAGQLDRYFEQRHQLDLFKKTSSVKQLLQQGEIDVLGAIFNSGSVDNIYAIDIAFHENGLNYGSKEETITRILKKMVRSVLLLHGYFKMNKGEIIFATPKVTDLISKPLIELLKEAEQLLVSKGLKFNLVLICNEDFNKQVYEEVLSKSSSVADTSELFMRALQLSSLTSTRKPRTMMEARLKKSSKSGISGSHLNIGDMKIGAYIRLNMTRLIESKLLSDKEVERLQQTEYSKNTFNINLPVLKLYDRKVDLSLQRKINNYDRYYRDLYHINGEDYLLCNHWVEDLSRSYFDKWLEMYK